MAPQSTGAGVGGAPRRAGVGPGQAKGHQASNAGSQQLQLRPGSVQGTAVWDELSSEARAEGTVGEGGPVLWV